MKRRLPRIAFAGSRAIGVQALELLLEHGLRPVALMIPNGPDADESAQQLKRRLRVPTLEGKSFQTSDGIQQIAEWEVDYILSIHYPYLIPRSVLSLPRQGVLNLHPGLLPFNRGWHTPSWAILEGTPYGATLHWVDEGTDTGDIALQEPVAVHPSDTAHGLYARVLKAEVDLLYRAIPLICKNQLPRIPQPRTGTAHRRGELKDLREVDLDQLTTPAELLRKLRALTTNRTDEAAWFEVDGQRYSVTVTIQPTEEQLANPMPARLDRRTEQYLSRRAA